VLLLGGAALRANGTELFVRLAEALGAAVITTWRARARFRRIIRFMPSTGFQGYARRHPFHKKCGLILSLGARFADETTCSYRDGLRFRFEDKADSGGYRRGRIGKKLSLRSRIWAI
jgi:thiamine pyrophosphate-dependent acetolactate synthase large subunit-like protein